jgi:hypothetical protein
MRQKVLLYYTRLLQPNPVYIELDQPELDKADVDRLSLTL